MDSIANTGLVLDAWSAAIRCAAVHAISPFDDMFWSRLALLEGGRNGVRMVMSVARVVLHRDRL